MPLYLPVRQTQTPFAKATALVQVVFNLDPPAFRFKPALDEMFIHFSSVNISHVHMFPSVPEIYVHILVKISIVNFDNYRNS